jgi:hypothetical protein
MAERVYEDDIEAAHTLAEKILGSHGRIVYPLVKGDIPNARVLTKNHGTIWYGDLEMRDVSQRIPSLSIRLGVPVFVEQES